MLLLSGLFGAFLGATVTLFFNLWKHSRDEFDKRCDDLCKIVSDSAALGVAYWSDDFSSGKETVKFAVAEAHIKGIQSLIDGTYADIRESLHKLALDNTDEVLSDYTSLLTGGEFSEPGRPTSPDRVSKIPPQASNFIIAVRRASRSTMPYYRVRQHIRSNRARVLDMPDCKQTNANDV